MVSDDGFFLSRRLMSSPFVWTRDCYCAEQRREERILERAKTNSRWAHGQAGNSNSPTFGRKKVPITGSFPTANNRMIDDRLRTGPLAASNNRSITTVYRTRVHASRRYNVTPGTWNPVRLPRR